MNPFVQYHMSLVEDTEWDPFGRAAGTRATKFGGLTGEGLCLPGLLWQVNDFIDLSAIQTKYQQQWKSLMSLTGRFHPGRTTVESAATLILFEIIAQLKASEHVDLANAVLNSTSNWRWKGLRSSIATVKRSIHVDNNKTFDSRSRLFENDLHNLLDPSGWKLNFIETVEDVPSDVNEDNSRGMFALDIGPDDGYQQTWFVDRVMEEGGVWDWRLVKQTANPWGFDGPHETDMVLFSIDEGSNASGRRSLGQPYCPPKDAVSAQYPPMTHGEAMIIASAITRNIDRQLQCHYHAPHDAQLRETDSGLRSRNTVQSLLMLCAGAQGKSIPDVLNAEKRRAIFDIDCAVSPGMMVLTPLKMNLEAIPRSRTRSMSISWVVEPVRQCKENGIEGQYKFKAKHLVRGMWPFSTLPTGRYLLM